jgi:DNA repair exonuclease SbcCD ATPase subunit
MNTALVVVIVVLFLAVVGLFLWCQKLNAQIAALRGEAERTRDLHAADLQRAVSEAQDTIRAAQAAVDDQIGALPGEIERIRQHYEDETRKVHVAAEAELSKALNELSALRRFAELGAAEAEVSQKLEDAAREAESVRAEAVKLLDDARTWCEEDRRKAADQAKKLVERAHQTLDEATREAGRLVAEAEKRAEGIAGDAYIALRDKAALESAVAALWNVANGYGDRYVVPTHSILDDLAEDFGHAEAGVALKAARDRTRRMVEQAQASACNYVEQDRRERANRFVVDAFNGRVDAILSRVRHDNYGTLVQEIRDAFSLVNLNGIAFRDARVLPAYLDARLEELKWAVAVYELRVKEREEQRRIKEQIREEEKARKEYEKAMQQAQREEEIIRQAMDKARLQAELASADQKAKFNEQLALLSQRLTEAEARNQRAISMAQQTRKGNIYIISNIGAFGEDVFKIGMTRRLEPLDRVRELGDASVPFEFDVHAIIPADDAPALEYQLHTEFDDLRVNKVNYRKEFFRLPLSRVREYLSGKGVDVSFTMVAEAHEYRESVALSKMTPEEREKHVMLREAEDEVGGE